MHRYVATLYELIHCHFATGQVEALKSTLSICVRIENQVELALHHQQCLFIRNSLELARAIMSHYEPLLLVIGRGLNCFKTGHKSVACVTSVTASKSRSH